MKMTNQRIVCNDVEGKFLNNYEDSLVWVSIVAMLLSLVSFISTWVYFYGMAEHMDKLQNAYDRRLAEQRREQTRNAKQLTSTDYNIVSGPHLLNVHFYLVTRRTSTRLQS